MVEVIRYQIKSFTNYLVIKKNKVTKLKQVTNEI